MNNPLGKLHEGQPRRGFSVVEILVAVAIFSVAMVAFVFAFDMLGDVSGHVSDRTQAGLLLEESSEAILVLRDVSWSGFIASSTLGSPYTLRWTGSIYQLATTSSSNDTYTRQVTFFPVYRTATGAIAQSGTLDTDTRRVLIEIIRTGDSAVMTSAEMLVHHYE